MNSQKVIRLSFLIIHRDMDLVGSVIIITIDTRLNMERFLSVKGNTSILFFSNYEGNEEISGVIVTISEKEYNIPCRKKITNKLVDLIPLLQCDKEDALGCYPKQ